MIAPATNERRFLAVVLSSVALAAASSLTLLLAACTSGTTPNCSDAADMCDPYEAGTDSAGDAGAAEASLHGG